MKTLQLHSSDQSGVWFQHELQQKIKSLLSAASGCSNIYNVHGLCVKDKDLLLVMEYYPVSLDTVLASLQDRGKPPQPSGLVHTQKWLQTPA